MKVAIVSAGELYGGVERHIFTFVSARNADDTMVVLFHDRQLAADLRSIGANVIVVSRRSIVDSTALKTLRQAIEELCADIVHVHGYLATVYAALAIARLKRRIPIVKTVHGMPERGGEWTRSALKERAYHLLDRAVTVFFVDYVTYVSKDLQSSFSTGKFFGTQSSVIYNGILPCPKPYKTPAELRKAGTRILFVGRLEHVKGPDLAIVAIQLLRDQGIDVHLFILGDGPLRIELAEQARTLKIGDKVTFKGHVRNATSFIAYGDILLLPSRHEGLPYVLLEAMSEKTLVIAARTGGLKEVLHDGETALFFPVNDAQALAELIERVINRRVSVHGILQNAEDLVREKFSAKQMVSAYEELYAKLVRSKPLAH